MTFKLRLAVAATLALGGLVTAASASAAVRTLTESKMALRRGHARRKMPAQVPSLRASRAVRPAARRGRRACGSLPFHPFRARPARGA